MNTLTITVNEAGQTQIHTAEGITGQQLLQALAMSIVSVMEICDHMAKDSTHPQDAAVLKQSVMSIAEQFLRGGVDVEIPPVEEAKA